MALNIPAIAARGAAKARLVAATALTGVTVRSGPTDAYNPATDANTTTWSVQDVITGLLYAEQIEEVDGTSSEEINAVITGRAKKLLVWESTLTAIPNERSTVVIGAEVWMVKAVEPDPTASIFILRLRR